MQRALKYKKRAEWVDTGRKKRSKKRSGEKSSKKSKKSKSSTRTEVAGRAKSKAVTVFPGTIRVEAPTTEALKHIIEVENSGCLSGG